MGSFDPINLLDMTTGRRFSKRTKDHAAQHVLDARAKAVLASIAGEPRGRALDAYIRAMKRTA